MKGQTKTLWALAVLILVSCAPAHAQAYVGSSASSYGSAINSGQNGLAKANFPTHYSLPDASTQVQTFSGNTEFVPSLFMSFDKALAKGVADLAAKPKTLAEVAQEYRKEQRAKAQTSFVQGADGKPVKAEKE